MILLMMLSPSIVETERAIQSRLDRRAGSLICRTSSAISTRVKRRGHAYYRINSHPTASVCDIQHIQAAFFDDPLAVSARIDGRPELERTLLQAAAAIGREFASPVLARVASVATNFMEAAVVMHEHCSNE
jgi:hypothetical protein